MPKFKYAIFHPFLNISPSGERLFGVDIIIEREIAKILKLNVKINIKNKFRIFHKTLQSFPFLYFLTFSKILSVTSFATDNLKIIAKRKYPIPPVTNIIPNLINVVSHVTFG